MSNFGFAQLRLVNPYDVAFREARSAVRSHYILERAQLFNSVAEAVADAKLVVGSTSVGKRDLHVPLYRLEPAAGLLKESLASGSVALLFGSEKFGLSNEHMSHCHWLFRIPARDEHGSMNLGQAVAITLYELRRDAALEAQRFAPSDAISGEKNERFTMLLRDALDRSGYIEARTAGSTELKLRRLVRRLGMPASDAEMWLGMIRQILWKLKQSDAE